MMKYIKHIALALVMITVIPLVCTVAARSISEKALTAGRAVSSAARRSAGGGEGAVMPRISADTLSASKEKRLIYLVDLVSRRDCSLHLLMLVSLDRSGASPCALHIPTDSIICPEGECCLLCDYFAESISEKKQQGAKDKEAVKYADRKLSSYFEGSLNMSIDGCLSLYTEGLGSIVDQLGRVEFKADRDTCLLCSDGSRLTLKKGYNRISGKDVTTIMENRDGSGKYEKKLLFALGKRVKKGMYLPDIIRITRVLSKELITDLSIPDLVTALSASSASASEKLITVEATGERDKKTGGVYLNEEELMNTVRRSF